MQKTVKALFLDRDGVINKDHGYVHSMDNFELIDGIFDLCKIAKKNNYRIIIVTNQSGIAREYYSEEHFLNFMDALFNFFQKRNIFIDDFYYCPHHPSVKNVKYSKECLCRKPQPGMIIQALSDHNIDPSKSVLVGDQITDIKAGLSANINKLFLFAPENENHNYQGYTSVSNLESVGKYLEVAHYE